MYVLKIKNFFHLSGIFKKKSYKLFYTYNLVNYNSLLVIYENRKIAQKERKRDENKFLDKM